MDIEKVLPRVIALHRLGARQGVVPPCTDETVRRKRHLLELCPLFRLARPAGTDMECVWTGQGAHEAGGYPPRPPEHLPTEMGSELVPCRHCRTCKYGTRTERTDSEAVPNASCISIAPADDEYFLSQARDWGGVTPSDATRQSASRVVVLISSQKFVIPERSFKFIYIDISRLFYTPIRPVKSLLTF